MGAIIVGPRLNRFADSRSEPTMPLENVPRFDWRRPWAMGGFWSQRFPFLRVRGRPLPPHNMVFTALGTGILWFGWFAFNAGSTQKMSGGSSCLAGLIAVNTTLAPAAACITSLAVSKFLCGVYDVQMGQFFTVCIPIITISPPLCLRPSSKFRGGGAGRLRS